MTTDEEIKAVIQSLQEQMKYGQEVNNEASLVLWFNSFIFLLNFMLHFFFI